MSTTEATAGGTGTGPEASLTLLTDAILTWRHRRGQSASCLARLRGIRDPSRAEGLLVAVVVSELRDQPRGHHVLSDFAGIANTVLDQFLPPAAAPAAITWYAHHGQFSTYDPAGPETLTRVALAWDGARYQQPGTADLQLVPAAQAREVSTQLRLQPVETLLAALPWDIPTPRQDSRPPESGLRR